MAQRKRGKVHRKSGKAPEKRGKAPQKSARAVQKRGKGPQQRRPAGTGKAARAQEAQRLADQQLAEKLFELHIGPLWDRISQGFKEFADAFNQEMGKQELVVESHQSGIMAKFPQKEGAEVGLQLEREHHHIECWINSGWMSMGSSIVDRPPIGLAILDGHLRVLFRGDLVSEEDLAVQLLTTLTGGDESPAGS